MFVLIFVLALFQESAAKPMDLPQAILKQDDDTVIKREITLIPVVIENQSSKTLFLWRVEGNSSKRVFSLWSDRKRSLKVESGFYFVSNDDGVGYFSNEVAIAVPAWSDALNLTKDRNQNCLTITVVDPPPYDERWKWIPNGPALIGDILGVGQEDERPARIEDVPSFWLSKFEVTNAEYADFLNHSPRVEDTWLDLQSQKCRIKKMGDHYATDAPRIPVVTVTFVGAQEYCRWLSQSSGRNCRLPTEVEWEKAARGPDSLTYSYGNTYRQDSANQESGQLLEVGNFAPNEFGLYDMTGNAFEWVADAYKPVAANKDLQGMTHVLRGGSYVLDGMYLRNSFRMRQSPTVMADDIGFRVARDATEKELQK